MAEDKEELATSGKKIAPVDFDNYLNHSHDHSSKFALKIILGVIILLIIVGGAFVLGRISNRNSIAKRGVVNQQFFGPSVGMRGEMRRDEGKMMERETTSGSITDIDGNNLTVKTDSQEITVVISDSTSIRNSNGIAKKSDLAVGNNISVFGPSDANGQIQAKLIIIK
jgi:hypothetical protein